MRSGPDATLAPAAPGADPAAAPRPPAAKVLVFATVFPNAVQPVHGTFVRERMRGLPAEVEVRVVAPQPWFPLVSRFAPGYRPEAPREEVQDGVPVLHPRFLSLPGFGKCLDGLFLALSTLPTVARLRREFPFELIDAHFSYPEGMAAVLLGRLFRVPVTITLRGTLPILARFRLRRPQLRFALRRAARVIAVSETLRDDAVALGIPAEWVRVIPNGVDPAVFRPLDRRAARRSLGLPADVPLLVSVGSLSPRKGFDLVIEAMAALGDRWPELRFAVVGGAGAEGDVGPHLRRLAARLGVADRVVFAGPRQREELAAWYSAADASVLASAHEGCPNVVLEALACGTPVVATVVGDVPLILADPETGVLVERLDVPALAAAIDAALGRRWDQDRVRARVASRTWQAVGREVAEEMGRALASARGPERPAAVPLTILYHHRTRAADAQGIHISEIQRAFRLRGHEVVEVALVEAGAEARADEAGSHGRGLSGLASRVAGRLPLPVREAMELAYNLVAYRRLAAAIRRHRPAFIYERYAANTFAGLLAARRHKVPLVLEVNSPLALEKAEHDGLFFARLTRWIERRVASGADVTLAVTGVLRAILEESGVPHGKVVVMPNGVRRELCGLDRDGREGDAPRAAEVRRRLGVPDGAVLAGFIGWFRPWHGLERLVEAAASPAWREAGIYLALAGDGPATPALRAAVERVPGLSERVIFAGTVPRSDVEPTLAAFDVAVQPAVTSYACPMKILEYMAAGCAIVAPGSANVRELLDDGVTALLCPGGANPSAADLESAVVALARDPELRARLGRAARDRVLERGLLWEENARRVEELVAAARRLEAHVPRPARDREVPSC